MKKQLKFTKKKAQEFFKVFLGYNKGIYSAFDGCWTMQSGMMEYMAWINKDRIYCQISCSGECINALYFDFETYEYDYKLVHETERDNIHEHIMTNPEYWMKQIEKEIGK